MALVFLVMSVGGLLGPPCGGLAYHLAGWSFPFIGMALFALLVALPSVCVLKDNEHREEDSALQYIWNKQIFGILLAVFLVGYSTTQLEPILPLYLHDHFGAQPVLIGCIMMLFTLAHAGSSPAANSLEHCLGRIGVSATGLGLSAIFIPLIAFATGVWMVAAILVLAGISGGLVLAFAMPELAEILDQLGHSSHVTVYVLFDSAYACGMVVGSICGGILFEHGIQYPLLGVAMLLLCHAPTLYALSRTTATLGAVTRRPSQYKAVSMMDDELQGDSWEVSGRYGQDQSYSNWAPISPSYDSL